MRILVFSDSHGSTYYFRQALLMHPQAEAVIYLGDGERDLDTLRRDIGARHLIAVRGNCDLYSMLPERETVRLQGVNIYCTHGHLDGVRRGEETLVANAKAAGAQIALYGHTHYQCSSRQDGVYVMNPGSVMQGYYGFIDIEPSGIMVNTCRIER